MLRYGRISDATKYVKVKLRLACFLPPFLYLLDYHFDDQSPSTRSTEKTLEVRQLN